MKIVVIGRTAGIRWETVERLRGNGHDVVAASPRRAGTRSVASRDPGHAGRPLRELLGSIGRALRELSTGLLQRPWGRREKPWRAGEPGKDRAAAANPSP